MFPESVPSDFGAHGAFDDRARTRDHLVWVILHRRGVEVGGIAAVVVVAAAALGLARRVTSRG